MGGAHANGIEESEDETLMDRYLSGEEVSTDILIDDLEKAVARGAFFPVIPVCSTTACCTTRPPASRCCTAASSRAAGSTRLIISKKNCGEVWSHGDHRIAMSFAVAGLKAGGTSIRDERCVDKSFPGFWRVFRQLADR